MGVDFYTCANCQNTFCDAGYYFSCESCGEHYCSNKCGGRQVSEPPDDVMDSDEEWEEVETCTLCRVETVKDWDMVQFLLKKANLTYDQAVDMFRKELPEEDEDD